MASPILYFIDTSSIFKWYIEVYPPTIFEGLQERVEELIRAGRLRSPKAVFDEIKPSDDCHTWAKGQTDLFVEETLTVQQIVRQLMTTQRTLIYCRDRKRRGAKETSNRKNAITAMSRPITSALRQFADEID